MRFIAVKPRACLDTTIFIDYFVFGVDKISRYIASYSLCTPSSVLWETTYILLKAKAMKDAGIRKHYEVLKYLRENPDYVRTATKEIVNDIKTLISLYKIRILRVSPYRYMVREMLRYGLLPSDALIVATCRLHKVKTLITCDEDFKRVVFLEIEIP